MKKTKNNRFTSSRFKALQGSLPKRFFKKTSLLHLSLFSLCICTETLQLCLTLWSPMVCFPPGSSVHRNSQGKNTRVGCHALFQGSSQPRDQTASHRTPESAGRFFTNNTTWEAHFYHLKNG